MVARSLCNEDFLTLKLPTSGGVAVACETFQVIHSMQRVAYRYISWCTYQLQPFKSGNPSPCRQIYRTSVKGSVDKCPFNGTGLGISQGQHYMAPKFFHVHVSALHSGTGTSTASGRAYHQQPRPAKWWWYKYLFFGFQWANLPFTKPLTACWIFFFGCPPVIYCPSTRSPRTILFLRKILGVWQKWMAGIRCLHMSSAKNACRTSPMFKPITVAAWAS